MNQAANPTQQETERAGDENPKQRALVRLGVNMMRPKNPVQKPTAPVVMAADIMVEINPSGMDPICCHV